MRLFSALFNLAVLPVAIARDVVCLLPDLSCGIAPMSATKQTCENIDEEISK